MKNIRILLALLAVCIIGYVYLCKEPFGSPGTLVQLASSHVPTQEEVDNMQKEYVEEVRRDLTDMTGDPGPISVPMPQMFL